MRDIAGWRKQIAPPRRLPDMPTAGTVLLVLRWLVLVLALVLASFDHLREGVLLAPGYTALIVAGYNMALSLAGRRVRWLQGPLNFLALDTLVAAGAVYLTGGYHSGFFMLFVSIIIGAALYLDLAPTVLVVILISLIFAAVCAINPAGLRTPEALSALAVKALPLQLLGVVTGLLLEGLRREHQETERERQQTERLRALEQAQRSFINSIAHELRTPLTCIRASVELLQSAATPEVRRELVGTIEHHAGRLEGLVSDLLESTRLEAGQIMLTRQPTDLRLIVERTVRAMTPLIQQRGQHLETALPEAPLPADVDRRRMEQVLTNLVANACKFTPKGGHIWVALARNDGELIVSVADDGEGIPAEHLPHLFQRFYTVPGGTARTGLGLGLYVARAMVELHGGRVWVTSKPGQGSTFFVAVPALLDILPGNLGASEKSAPAGRPGTSNGLKEEW